MPKRDPGTGRWLKNKRVIVECVCGCGETFENRNELGDLRKYVKGHNRRGLKYTLPKRVERKMIDCACGCGVKLLNINKGGYHRKYIWGHNRRGQHHPNSCGSWYINKESVLKKNTLNERGLEEIFGI